MVFIILAFLASGKAMTQVDAAIGVSFALRRPTRLQAVGVITSTAEGYSLSSVKATDCMVSALSEI